MRKQEIQEGAEGVCWSLRDGDPHPHTLSSSRMNPTQPAGHGPLPVTPPPTGWDLRAGAPGGPAARQPQAAWPRRMKAAGLRFWATCRSSVCFLIFIFLMSTLFHCHQRLAQVPSPWASPARVALVPRYLAQEGMFTINSRGRLGNQMGQYATLYALAKTNGRPAFIPAQMHRTLAPIFRISLPVLHDATASSIPWRNYHLNDWMEEQYRHIQGDYVRLTGYPCSWTFYHHLRDEILREFTLHDHVREEAQRFLRGLRVNGSRPSTFVGVHVRRGDYVQVMPRVWKGVVADPGYLRRALAWFRARYRAAVFVVSSDDMPWCRRNIDRSLRDVVLAGSGRQGSPARDFALLTQCNHSVITVGTFGIWAAYLTGGHTVYLANYTLPDSPFRWIFRPEAAFLPEWVGIAADLGLAGDRLLWPPKPLLTPAHPGRELG
ncbi:galactoside 2-alpha-L-fucosyltransferase SEC1-like [Talpa occidentalis]|uniref:galactoside 2-alpha-L-fucosyltransferase SEC1-like n=1 Tax=Talpa occidentalis TaxID=50954 RepID=UPI00188FBA14|nr:galactoside 2-alpha-L-fucosyltransferase SEC1-like [Talpa occidentalis]